jgi:hypothetical protein
MAPATNTTGSDDPTCSGRVARQQKRQQEAARRGDPSTPRRQRHLAVEDGRRGPDQPEKEAVGFDRIRLQKHANDPKNGHDGCRDAGTQRKQKSGVDLPECCDGVGSTLGSQPAEDAPESTGFDCGDRADQPLVDPRNEGDGAAGDAGYCVRCAHAEAAEIDADHIAECRHYRLLGGPRHW